MYGVPGTLSHQVVTTTTLKMAVLQVLLAAGDTFRAAAAEQLQQWAVRSQVEVHTARTEKARPDNVLYEAVDKVYPVFCIMKAGKHTVYDVYVVRHQLSVSCKCSALPSGVSELRFFFFHNCVSDCMV